MDSCNGTLYVGVTANLLGRVMQHREGRYRGFTKRYGVYRPVWFDVADPVMEAAIAAEKRIRKWPRDDKKDLIERIGPTWDDLTVGLGLPPLS